MVERDALEHHLSVRSKEGCALFEDGENMTLALVEHLGA
jgi:hypothetical protein